MEIDTTGIVTLEHLEKHLQALGVKVRHGYSF